MYGRADMGNDSQPIAPAVTTLMKERGWTYDSIDGRSNGTIGGGTLRAVAGGRRQPTLVTMEIIADLFDVPPDMFSEYQLARARALFDEREQGLDQALANLKRFETALEAWDAVAGEPEAQPSSEPVRHLRPATSASQGRSQGQA